MKFCIFILSVLSIVGCAKIYRYAEPTEGPMATVTVKTKADYININLVSYDGEEYLESKGNVITLLKSKAIGYPYKEEETIKVRAGEEFRFSLKVGAVQGAGGNKLKAHICMNHAGFVPQEGRSYQVVHNVVDTDCGITLSEDGKDAKDQLTEYSWCLDPWLTGSGYKQDDYCQEGFEFRK